jgi:IrrE N-terminal-like domain
MAISITRRWNSEIVRLFWKQVGGLSPFTAIEDVCTELQNQLGRSSPPFQSEQYEFARLLNVRVIENEISCDGVLALAGTRFVIQVRRNTTSERKNFTVCHELGHVEMLRRATDNLSELRSLMDARTRLNEEEMLSNFFAANLLMPRKDFVDRASQLVPSLDSLFQLARTYRTSVASTARRITELGVWKCHFFWCLPEARGFQRTVVRMLGKPIISESLQCPYKNAEYVTWGVKPIILAYEGNKTVDDRLIFQKHGGAAAEFWRLEAARHDFENETRVIALVRPE